MRDARILMTILLIVTLVPLVYSQSAALEVTYTSKDITIDPLSNIWNDATPLTIYLKPQGITNPTGGRHISINVRGLHNGEFIGFLMEWEDTTKDTKVTGEGYRDGAALQFPLDPNALTSPFMGDPDLVNIWFWRGDWQRDLEGEEYLDTEYPSFGGFYFPQDEQLFLKEIQGGNIIGASPVEDLNAKGFGTLETQEHQDIAGKGVYSNEKWKVTFIRSMVTSDEFDVQFNQGMTSKINFAVWDGSNSDRGGRKSVLFVWIDMAISEIPATGVTSTLRTLVESKIIRILSYGALFLALLIGVSLVVWRWVLKRQKAGGQT